MTDETKSKEKKRNKNLTEKENISMEKFAQSDAFKEFIKLIGSNKGVQRYFETTQCLKDEIKKEQYGGLSYDKIVDTGLSKPLDDIDLSALFNGEIDSYIIPGSLLDQALKNIKTNIKRTDNIEFPTDKINNKVWTDLEKYNNELTIAAENQKDKNQNKNIDISYSVYFDLNDLGNDIQITKALTAFDKRVYIATAALWSAGNTYFSITQIYKCMGYTSDKPPKKTIDAINESITKMQRTFVKIDNMDEINAKYNYPKFIYDSALLPVERVSKIINGKFTDAAIHLFREPPLISFAKGRKQITTLPIKILQSPIDKTELSIGIDDYLTGQIVWMKNNKSRSNKITYTNMCDKLKIENSRDNYNKIKRLKDKASDLIMYYKECEFIKDYTIKPDGIEIELLLRKTE